MLQNIPKEKVLEIVKQGPTYPAKIAKQLGSGGDTMLIGAILSTLISTGEVKVSSLKIGGTPLYYTPDQESKLEDFLDYLNEKDKRTFDLLKEQKILQDSEQDPLTRVSLRGIKDFAKSIEIDVQGQKILFWRFYSVTKDGSISLAKKNVVVAKPVEVTKSVEAEKLVEKPVEKYTAEEIMHKQDHKPTLVIDPKPLIVDKHAEQHLEKHIDTNQQVLETVNKDIPTEKIHEHHEKNEHQEHQKKTEIESTEKHSPPKKHTTKVSTESQDTESKAPKPEKASKPGYDFFSLILNHVAAKKLDVISKEKIKKTEYGLILKNHSTNEYIYCKAKDKSSISEGDLAPALIFAQNKKMPCLFISTGDLTKKAESMITKEFGGMTFEKIVLSGSVNSI
jgi:hypothetical protein